MNEKYEKTKSMAYDPNAMVDSNIVALFVCKTVSRETLLLTEATQHKRECGGVRSFGYLVVIHHHHNNNIIQSNIFIINDE